MWKVGCVDSVNPIFHCGKCNWIEDEWQENNPASKYGRNKISFDKANKRYQKHKKKYATLVDKIIKVKMKNGEIKEGPCRDFSYSAILMPNNGTWINIKEIKSIKVLKDVITIKCPILVNNNNDDELDEKTCNMVSFCVNNPGIDVKTENWIKAHNMDYEDICKKCKYNFKIYCFR